MSTTDTTTTPTTLSDGGLKLLLKIAKKMKGVVPVPAMLEIAPLLGWTITRVLAPRQGTSKGSQAIITAALTGLSTPNWWDEWRAGAERMTADDSAACSWRRGDAVKGRPEATSKAMIAALSTACTVLGKKDALPDGGPRGMVYLCDLAIDKEYGPGSVTMKPYTVTDGYTVHDASGALLGMLWVAYDHFKDGRIEESEEADKPGSVWTWAYKAGADVLAQKAIEALGDEATRRRRPEHPQGDDNTGICQICERRQKLKFAGIPGTLVLVDHGYTHENTGHSSRGWGQHGYLGQRQNSCWGVGYQPWEKDSSRLRWFRDSVILPGVQRLESYLARLQSGEVQSISIMETEGYGRSAKSGLVEYTPASTKWPRMSSVYSWASLVEREIDETEWELGKSKMHLARVEARLASWKLAPLYDELHPPTA